MRENRTKSNKTLEFKNKTFRKEFDVSYTSLLSFFFPLQFSGVNILPQNQ